MTVISQTVFLDLLLVIISIFILIEILLTFIPKGPIDNNPALG